MSLTRATRSESALLRTVRQDGAGPALRAIPGAAVAAIPVVHAASWQLSLTLSKSNHTEGS